MHEFNVLCRWKTDYSRCPEHCQICGARISETAEHGERDAVLDEQRIGGTWRGLWMCSYCEFECSFHSNVLTFIEKEMRK